MQFIRGGIIAVTARGPYGPIRALMGPYGPIRARFCLKTINFDEKS